SNGEEEGKGDELVRSTTPLMKDLPGINYVGNVEPKEVLKGETDIVVADGLVGNIMGKSFEAMASYMGTVLREELTANPVRMVGAALVKPGIDSLRARLDPEDIGGVPLLGVNGVVIIAHGRSSAKAIRNAVRQAKDAVDEQIVTAIRSSIGAG
ncbi:MAG: phosphate--acyl-ACP acyltransferase, partial [Anaerolineae bacterium]